MTPLLALFTAGCDRSISRLLLVVALLTVGIDGAIAQGDAAGQFSSRLWRADNGLPGDQVHSLVQDAGGHLWIATDAGVARFNGFKFEPVASLPTLPAQRSDSTPVRLFATADGAVWLAGRDGGLHRIETLVAREVLATDPAPAPTQVTQVVNLPGGGVVIRRGDEAWSWDGLRFRLQEPPPEEVTATLAADLDARARAGRIAPDGHPQVLVDSSGSSWIPGERTGLSVTPPGGLPFPVTIPTIGPDFEVSELLEDGEGNIWVATKRRGLGRLREHQVDFGTLATGAGTSPALAVLEDSREHLWIARPEGGVDQVANGVAQRHSLSSGADLFVASALYEDRSGGIWVATQDGPVLRWLGWRFVEQFLENKPSSVNALYQDSDGTLWLGGRGGLARATGPLISPIGAESNFPGGEVTCMTGGPEGELWLGTADGFVLRNESGRFRSVGRPADTGYSRISNVLVESANRLWVATVGGGLFLFDGGRWHHFGRAEGLPDTNLTCVTTDELGHLWVGSSTGVFRAVESTLIERRMNRETPIHWLRIPRRAGAPSSGSASGYSPAVSHARDGAILFATREGGIRVNPARRTVNRTPPPVFIDNTLADGLAPTRDGEDLTAGPGKTRLEFFFHGLNFESPESLTYQTQLLGYDSGWREVGTRGQVSYEAVPPGDYVFTVMAMNNAGVASAQPATVSIMIRPNFWETRWFVLEASLLVIVVAGGIGWLIARGRLKRRLAALSIANAREAERARIARDLHDDLGASLTEISLLAGLSAEQAAGSGFADSLEELSDKSRAVSQALDEIVWAANPTEDSFVSLIDYIAGFAHEFLDRAGINLRLDVPSDLPDSPMDTTLRHSIFLAVREAFNNIAKHSKASTAWLQISLEGQVLDIRIEDDGCGISDEVLTRGDGLKNFHERMESCGGECQLGRREGGGTVIRFKVPLA